MNYYAKAIEILCTWNTEDMKALVGKIAEKNPGVIVVAAKEVKRNNNPISTIAGIPEEPHWHAEAKRFIQKDRFIDAVKYCQEQTGWSLREAKEACDLLR